jgi:hypothetical protein
MLGARTSACEVPHMIYFALSVSTSSATIRSCSPPMVSRVPVSDQTKSDPLVGAFIPCNPAAFMTPFSERMSKAVPQLTLDFLSEFFVGFDKSSAVQKSVCLQYINPWIQNLSGFQNPTVSYYEHSGAKLRDAIRSMIDITMD